jgi:hypothetical protein
MRTDGRGRQNLPSFLLQFSAFSASPRETRCSAGRGTAPAHPIRGEATVSP